MVYICTGLVCVSFSHKLTVKHWQCFNSNICCRWIPIVHTATEACSVIVFIVVILIHRWTHFLERFDCKWWKWRLNKISPLRLYLSSATQLTHWYICLFSIPSFKMYPSIWIQCLYTIWFCSGLNNELPFTPMKYCLINGNRAGERGWNGGKRMSVLAQRKEEKKRARETE